MKYGLADKEINIINSVFKKRKEVKRVFIYGSRAKEDYKKTSDIDLAVEFNDSFDGINKIKYELDDLPLIYKIDIIDESKISPGDFFDEYKKNKKIFYNAKS